MQYWSHSCPLVCVIDDTAKPVLDLANRNSESRPWHHQVLPHCLMVLRRKWCWSTSSFPTPDVPFTPEASVWSPTAPSLSTQHPSIALQCSRFSQCTPAPSPQPQIVDPAPSPGPRVLEDGAPEQCGGGCRSCRGQGCSRGCTEWNAGVCQPCEAPDPATDAEVQPDGQAQPPTAGGSELRSTRQASCKGTFDFLLVDSCRWVRTWGV